MSVRRSRYDKRNNAKTPTRGFYLQLDDDFAGVGGDAQYWRVNAEGARLLSGHRKDHVGRPCHRRPYRGLGRRRRPPPSTLFFKGGETIRGFDRAGYGPRDLSSNNQDALGGQTYWAVTGEIRFPPALMFQTISASERRRLRRCRLALRCDWRRRDSAGRLHQERQTLPRRQLSRPIVGWRQLDVELAGRPDPHGLRQGLDERKLRPGPSSSASAPRPSSKSLTARRPASPTPASPRWPIAACLSQGLQTPSRSSIQRHQPYIK